MILLRKAKKLGNSAGVLLPKKLLGSEVKISVLKRPVNIKKETLKLLGPYFENLRGIYITNKNPIEVLAVSLNVKEIIKNEKIKISVVPFSVVKRDIKTKQALRAKLIRAEIILNKALLSEMKKEIRA
jgi:hypothetical protein